MGTSPLLLKYPLDLTGKAPTNLIINEPRTIGSTTKRAFVPKGGPFYTNSVKIVDAANGNELRPVDQFLVLQPYQEASIRTGLDVAAVIYIKDPSVSSEILTTYQVVGGEFSWSVYALQEMLENLDLDKRPVAWGDVLGKPALYAPTPHLHDLGDTYGWEYIGMQLEGVRDAILTGDAAAHDELRQQFVYLIDQLRREMDDFSKELTEHREDYTNPHRVTKAQVGLGLVENFPIASEQEALQGTANNRYMTPLRSAALAARLAGEAVGAHFSDKNNPHQVTKAQVGLGSVDNFPTATTAEANAGAAPNRFMTPFLTKAAIDTFAGVALKAHVDDYNNPHRVTKAQVGLGLVDNFPTATTAQARASAAHLQAVTGNQFVVVGGLNEAIRTYHAAAVLPHLNDRNNPHQVTQTQVGLSNLLNVKQVQNSSANNIQLAWNGTEIVVTVDSTVMGRMHTRNQPDPNLTALIANRSNPHQVTAAQTGAYSTAQSDQLLANKLNINGTAVNSNLLAGTTRASILADAYAQVGTMGKRNLHVANRDPGAAEGAVGDIWFKY